MKSAFGIALAVALATASACSDHGKPEVKRDPEKRRVIEPPTPGVRALPPHAIRAAGVGPYRLGASLAELLDQLPSGPRIAQFNIPGVVRRDILRAEDDTVLIGGEPQGRASFVAVVGGEIARTESGIHVGSTRDELIRALGEPLEEPDRARDPRLIVPSSLRNAVAVLDGERIVALVVRSDATAGPRPAAGGDAGVPVACTRPAGDREQKKLGACLSGSGEIVTVDGDDIVVRGPDETHVQAQTRVPGLQFAAALRAPDGRDELVAISRTDDAQGRTWTLVGYRLEGLRLVRSIDPTPLYQLTAANARWIGAELRDLDLYLELASQPDRIEVGGLLTTRVGDRIRDLVMISPASAPRRRAKSPAIEAIDAGTTEAAGDAASASATDRKAKP